MRLWAGGSGFQIARAAVVIGGSNDLVAGKIQHAAVKSLEGRMRRIIFLLSDGGGHGRDRKSPLKARARVSTGGNRNGNLGSSIVKERAGVKEKSRCQGKTGVKEANGLQSIGPVKAGFWRGVRHWPTPHTDQNRAQSHRILEDNTGTDGAAAFPRMAEAHAPASIATGQIKLGAILMRSPRQSPHLDRGARHRRVKA